MRAAAGNKASSGPDHAKIAKLDRENEVAPPPTVSLELGKVIQKARQGYVNSAGENKPLSQGDLAKMLNVKSTVVQECEFHFLSREGLFSSTAPECATHVRFAELFAVPSPLCFVYPHVSCGLPITRPPLSPPPALRHA